MITLMTIEQRKEKFAEAVLEVIPALNRFAQILARDRVESEELVSETIVKAFEKFEDLKDERKTKPWLFKILRNQFITNYRKNKKIVPLLPARVNNSNDEKTFSLFEALGDTDFVQDGNAEKQFINKITQQQIQSAINGLPEEFKTALVLCDVEELTYAEISQILKIPVGTVRSRIARSRNILQKKLWREAKELGLNKRKRTKVDDYVCTCGNEEPHIHHEHIQND